VLASGFTDEGGSLICVLLGDVSPEPARYDIGWIAMVAPDPSYKRGESVVLRSTREMGRIEDDPIRDAGEYWYKVRFVKRVENVVEDELDPVDDADQSLQHLVNLGRWGRVQAFRCALAVERIVHTNRSTVYAYRAQRILFEPYQYKPLLKILDSADRRLLIADEVGLGKTIEAGLILTELHARKPLDRVLIVCPSRLRDKWREELNRKFDQDFDICNKRGFLEVMERLRQNPRRSRLRAIVSLETLRSEQLREMVLADLGYIDLVVIDEAHHARNPVTKTSELLRELCEVGDCVIMLTATPLHLGSRDLFTLLQALRPAEFRDPNAFDSQLHKHSGLHEATRRVRSQNPSQLALARECLESVFLRGVAPADRDPLAVQLIEELHGGPPGDRRGWVDLERRVQDLHPLASIVTRTRKRDVQEHAPVRRAAVVRCRWTSEEEAIYRKLVTGSARLDWFSERLSLGQIQRARQAASCLPAALDARGLREGDEAVEWADILPDDAPDAAREPAPPLVDSPAWTCPDSKYGRLREILDAVWCSEPNAKVLVFTYFVGTSRYLSRRLSEDGFPALRIAGDVPSHPHLPEKDERGRLMRQFRSDPAVRVLVSTEVGSEGLDFQFCHHLVNYDLPWNPMVVEQRIGRIDRFGQESDFVAIHNLVVEGTVEDRILMRLYERIGIFRESIGDLEAILGETMSALQRDYLCGKLSPQEADVRVEQAARAIEAQRITLEQLEKTAGALFGHEEYIRDEMNRVSHLGRYVGPESMLAVISSYLAARHPDVRLWKDEGEPGIYGLRLTDDLSRDLHMAARGTPGWIDRNSDGQMRLTFQGEVAFRRPDVELVNVAHPLIRAAIRAVRSRLEAPSARVARTILEVPDVEFSEGIYFVAAFTHTVEGLRARIVLEPVAWSEPDQTVIDSEAAERLLHLVLERGTEWDEDHPAPPLPLSVWEAIQAAARARNRELREREGREHQALRVRRTTALKAEYKHDRSVKLTRLQTATDRGRERLLPALRGQLQKADAEYRARLAELEQTDQAGARLSDPIAACVVRVRRPS
jgi:superfamily II DNA or RNA helicase